jgi:hypothetical protein
MKKMSQEIHDLNTPGTRIQAIKEFRSITGWRLLDSKLYLDDQPTVEMIARTLGEGTQIEDVRATVTRMIIEMNELLRSIEAMIEEQDLAAPAGLG